MYFTLHLPCSIVLLQLSVSMAPIQAPSASNQVHNICQRSGWPQPKLDFYVDQDDEDLLHGNLLLGNHVVSSSSRRSFEEISRGNRSYKAVKSDLYRQILRLIESNEVTFSPNLVYWRDEALCAAGGTLSLNSGCPPQLTKRKKLSKGKGCQARCYARLVEKVGAIQFTKCSTCGHLNCKCYLAHPTHHPQSVPVSVTAGRLGLVQRLHCDVRPRAVNLHTAPSSLLATLASLGLLQDLGNLRDLVALTDHITENIIEQGGHEQGRGLGVLTSSSITGCQTS